MESIPALDKLKALKESGKITDDVYEQAKEKILSQNTSKTSPLEKLDRLKSEGKITDDVYEQAKEKILSQNTSKTSPLEKLDRLKSEGKITDDVYEQAKIKLEETKQDDNAPEKKEMTWGEALGEGLKQSAQNIAKTGRNIATIPGAILDLPSLAYNIPAMIAGKQTYFPSHMIGSGIDYLTGGYTKPETLGDKLLEAGIQAAGSMGLGSASASIKAIQNYPKLAKFLKESNAFTASNVGSTAGAIGAGTTYAHKNPDSALGTLGASVAGGVGGGIFGSIAKNTLNLFKNKPHANLPEYTAAQRAPIGSEEYDKLVSNQEKLIGSNYGAARALSKIQKNQQENIYKNLINKKKHTSSSEVQEGIIENFKNLKELKNTDYENNLNEILSKYNGKPADLTEVYDFLNQMKRDTPNEVKFHQTIDRYRKEITANKDDILKLKELKTIISQEAYAKNMPELHLNTKASANIKELSHKLNKTIEKTLPGLDKLNQEYKRAYDYLDDLQEGIVGKSIKQGEHKPSTIFENIFLNPDKEKALEFRKVIPEELYNNAAAQFVRNITKENLKVPSANKVNRQDKFKNLKNFLEKNKEILNITLPSDQQKKINQAIKKIDVSEIGVPSYDFSTKTKRGKGKEVEEIGKNFGLPPALLSKSVPSLIGAGVGSLVGGGYPGMIAGALIGKGAGHAGSSIYNNLLKNEMLHGLSPKEQVLSNTKNKIGNITPIVVRNQEKSKEEPTKRQPLKVVVAPKGKFSYHEEYPYIRDE